MNEAVCEMAQVMAWELESTRLRVGLAPSQTSGREWRRRIRVVEETNPEWYQRFCLEHSDSLRTRPRKRKKPDTYIKRAHTLRALNEIASGSARTEYAQRLMPYVLSEAKRYEQESTSHPERTRSPLQAYEGVDRGWRPAPGRSEANLERWLALEVSPSR